MSTRAAFSRLGSITLLAIHVVAAGFILSGLYRTWTTRSDEIATLERAAIQEHQHTLELERQVEVQEALLDGLHAQDPYAVELQARGRLGWTGPHEIRPPPRPDQVGN